MKRLSTILFLTLLLTAAQGSFAQTATPTATATRAPIYKVGAIQANNPAGLPILGSDGSTLELIGPSGLILDASQVTAGTFGDGSYVFQDNLTFSGTDPVLNFPNSDYIKYTNSTAVVDFHNGTSSILSIDLDDGYAGIGANNAAYKFNVLNSGASGPDYAGYFSNTSTEESSQVGVIGKTTGAHTAGVNYGTQGWATNSTAGNIGLNGYVYGAVGYGRSVDAANGSTAAADQYGVRSLVNGTAGGTSVHYGLYSLASGGTTNWDLYTNGTQSRIAGMLQLTDSGQQITVDTTNDRFLFGDATNTSQVILDTTYGDVLLKGRLNLDAGSALTISSNAVTVVRTRHSLTASGASDTLNTINGGTSGDILYLSGTAGKTITVADGAGNIECNTNRTLDGVNDWMTLIYDGSNWQMLSIALDN